MELPTTFREESGTHSAADGAVCADHFHRGSCARHSATASSESIPAIIAWDDALRAYQKSIRGDDLESLFPDEEDDHRWFVGDYCKAVFSGDGLIYEAKVTKIWRNFCTVKFLGYNNKEDVKISLLKASGGKEARREQIRIAKALLNVNDDESGKHYTADGAVCADHFHRGCCARHSATAPSESAHQPFMPPPTSMPQCAGSCVSCMPSQAFGRYGPSVLPRSPGISTPPMLPLAPHLLMDGPGLPNELAPVLSAWYMSGYYTGLYQAGKGCHGCHCSSSQFN